MTGDNLKPLSSDLRSLLELERARPEPSADALARLGQRIEAQLDWLDAGEALRSAPQDPSVGQAGSPPPAHAPAAGAGAAAGASKAVGVVAAHWKLVVLSFAAGGLVTHGAEKLIATQAAPSPAPAAAPPQVLPPAAPTPEPQPALLQEPLQPEPPAAPREAPPPVRRKPSPPPAATPEPAPAVQAPAAKVPEASDRDLQLSGERALLEMARTALARGKLPDAENALATHLARYPEGLLSEEREALGVHLLIAGNRLEEASARLAQFERRYPKSLLAPALKASVERRRGQK